jgi:tetratricopeptide (TPR) repeat protein
MVADIIKNIAVCLVIMGTGIRAVSQHNPSELYSSILGHILSLQFDTADSLMDAYNMDLLLTENQGEAIHTEHDIALRIMYLHNYLEFLDALIEGDRICYKNYLSNSEGRLEYIRTAFGDLPERLSVIAAIHLQSSFLNAYHGDNFKAARNFYVARRYSRQAVSTHPGDPGHDKIEGLIYLVAGAAPSEYNWLMRIFGIQGDIEKGFKYLGRYHDASAGVDDLESCLILLYARQLTGMEQGMGSQLMDCGGDTITLDRYFHAYHALKSGRSQEAIKLLGTYRQKPGETKFCYVDLLLGEAKLNSFDPDAGKLLLRFLQETRGEHFVKTAWHKLSWYHYLNKDTSAYNEARENVIQNGNMIMDADKQAFREASDKTPINPDLLRSRLYFDGGYYEQSLEVLSGITPEELDCQRDSLEYTYRRARISDCLGEMDEAILGYIDVIENGQGTPWYFPSNAALHLGLIYEATGNSEKAIESYQTCLKMNRSAYRNSIGIKAKQGIRRLK